MTEARDFITGIATSRTNNLAPGSTDVRIPASAADLRGLPGVAAVIAPRTSNTRGEPVSADELQRDTKALYDTV